MNVEQLFTYHPPTTEERIDKHNRLNTKCLELAELVNELIEDGTMKTMIMHSIQQTRMFTNQAITMEDINKKCF